MLHWNARNKTTKAATAFFGLFFGVLLRTFLQGIGEDKRRINLMVRDDSGKYLRIKYHYKMEAYNDLTIKIPVGKGCAGEAWERNDMILGDRCKGLSLVDNKEEIAKIPPGLQIVLSAPIRHPDSNQVIAILNVDSFDGQDWDIFQADEFVLKLRGFAAHLGLILSRILEK